MYGMAAPLTAPVGAAVSRALGRVAPRLAAGTLGRVIPQAAEMATLGAGAAALERQPASEIGKRAAQFATLGAAGATAGAAARAAAAKVLPTEALTTRLGRSAVSAAGGLATGTTMAGVDTAVKFLKDPEEFDKAEAAGDAVRTALFFAGIDTLFGLLSRPTIRTGRTARPEEPAKPEDFLNDYEFLSGTRNPAKEGYREWKPGSGIWLDPKTNLPVYREIVEVRPDGTKIYKLDVWKAQREQAAQPVKAQAPVARRPVVERQRGGFGGLLPGEVAETAPAKPPVAKIAVPAPKKEKVSEADLLDRARQMIREAGITKPEEVSASLLQRNLKIGYNRASKLAERIKAELAREQIGAAPAPPAEPQAEIAPSAASAVEPTPAERGKVAEETPAAKPELTYEGIPDIPEQYIRYEPVRSRLGEGFAVYDRHLGQTTTFGKILRTWEQAVETANEANRREYARRQAYEKSKQKEVEISETTHRKVSPKVGGTYTARIVKATAGLKEGQELTGTVRRVYKAKTGAVLAEVELPDGTKKNIPVSKYAEWYPTEAPVTETAVAPEAKEAWQMTKEEYIAAKQNEFLAQGLDEKEVTDPNQVKMWAAAYEQEIVEALDRGQRPSDVALDSLGRDRALQLKRHYQSILADYQPKDLRDWEKPYRQFLAEVRQRSGPIRNVKSLHRGIVEQALSEGKPVPSEVLKDYPDLAAKYERVKPKPQLTPKAKEPWEMTKEEFVKNPPPGYRYSGNKPEYAKEHISWVDSEGRIVLSDDFFGHSIRDRKEILKHEAAHQAEGLVSPETKAALFDNAEVMTYRGRNINEKLANWIADGKPLPDIVRNDLQQALSEGKPVPSEVLKDYPDLAAKYGKQAKAPVTETATASEAEAIPAVETAAKISQPIIVYHGTTQPISQFDISELRSGSSGGLELGPHFGSLYQVHSRLETLAQRRAAEAGRGLNVLPEDYADMHVIPIRLDIKNPVTLPDAGSWNASAIAMALDAYPGETNLTKEQVKRIKNIGLNEKLSAKEKLDQIKAYLQELGYDGIRYKNKVEGSGWSYIPFSGEQIQAGVSAVTPEAEAVPAAEAVTGQPFTATLFHGSGKPKKEIYTYLEKPIVGEGRYYTFAEADAKFYGDKITQEEVSLNNPLVIRNDDEWRALTREAGWRYPNPYGSPKEEVSKWIDQLKQTIISKGHDGLIIQMDKEGDAAKTLRDVFGHDQVVVYPKIKAAPAAETTVFAEAQKPGAEAAAPAGELIAVRRSMQADPETGEDVEWRYEYYLRQAEPGEVPRYESLWVVERTVYKGDKERGRTILYSSSTSPEEAVTRLLFQGELKPTFTSTKTFVRPQNTEVAPEWAALQESYVKQVETLQQRVDEAKAKIEEIRKKAQAEYEQELKKERLLVKYRKGEVPEEKLDEIQKRILPKWEPQMKEAQKELEQAEDALRRFQVEEQNDPVALVNRLKKQIKHEPTGKPKAEAAPEAKTVVAPETKEVEEAAKKEKAAQEEKQAKLGKLRESMVPYTKPDKAPTIVKVMPNNITVINTKGYVGTDHWFIKASVAPETLVTRAAKSGNKIDPSVESVEQILTQAGGGPVLTPLGMISDPTPLVLVGDKTNPRSPVIAVNPDYWGYLIDKLGLTPRASKGKGAAAGLIGLYKGEEKVGVLLHVQHEPIESVKVGELLPQKQGKIDRMAAAAAPAIPPSRGRAGDVVAKTAILRFIQKEFNVPVHKGRYPFTLQKAQGVYKRFEQVIRTKKAEDLTVVAHEFGHHLDNVYGWSQQPRSYDDELFALAEALYGPDVANKPEEYRRREGIAEFTRAWLINPDYARGEAPKFYAEFEKAIDGDEEIGPSIRELQQLFTQYYNQNPEEMIAAAISWGPEKKPLTIERAREMGRETLRQVYAGLVDELDPLRISTETFERAWRARGYRGVVQVLIEGDKQGRVVIEGRDLGPSLMTILKPVTTLPGQAERFAEYAVAKRIVYLAEKRGWSDDKFIVPVEKAREVVAKLETPAFEAALTGVRNWSNVLLHYYASSGMLSQDAVEAMIEANEVYIPFTRLAAAGEKGMTDARAGTGKKMANLGQAGSAKTMRGGMGTIVNPLESLVRNAFTMVHLAERNRVANLLAQWADKTPGVGYLIEKVPPDVQATMLSPEELAKALKAAGVDPEDIKAAKADLRVFLRLRQLSKKAAKGTLTSKEETELEGLQEYQNQSDLDLSAKVWLYRAYMYPTIQASREGIVMVWRNGNPTFYQVKDPLIYRALLMLDTTSAPVVQKLLSPIARTLREFATITFEFIGRNVARDSLEAAVFGRGVPFEAMIRGVADIFGSQKWLNEWRSSGAANTTLNALDRDYLQRELNKVLAYRTGSLRNRLLSPRATMRELSEIFEEATRVGEFQMAMTGNNLMTKLLRRQPRPTTRTRAAIEARDVTIDFMRSGPWGRFWNSITAFFNAGTQSIDKFRRVFLSRETTAKEKAHRLARALLFITLPTVLLYLVNKDDEDYQRLPQWRKDLFWNIPLGNGHFVPIPINHIVGFIFKVVPERFMVYLETKDPEAFKGLWKTAGATLIPNILPTAVALLTELTSNYSFYLDRPIVPASEQRLEPALQYGPYTSETAKIAGKATGVSPRKVEYAARGIFGGAAMYAMDVTDWLLGITGAVKAPPPSQKEIPVLSRVEKAFYIEPTGSGTAAMEDFYDALNRMEMLWASVPKRAGVSKPLGDIDKWPKSDVAKYRAEKAKLSPRDQELLTRGSELRRVSRELSALRKQVKDIQNSKTMTTTQKEAQIKKLQKDMDAKAAAAVSKLKAAAKKAAGQ
jgi:hypothetical protein